MSDFSNFGRPDLIGASYQDEDISGADILGAIQQIVGAAGARRGRRAGRVADRAERAGEGRRGDRLERRLNRLMGAPNDNVQVARATPEVLRDYEMPLGRILVVAGDPGQLRETAQRVIRIERLILDSTALENFDVTSIAMGVEQQKVAIASSPARAYAFNAVGSTLRGNTLNIGMTATVSVLNVSTDDDLSIAGMFRGEAIQY